jgi:hypothetical protein
MEKEPQLDTLQTNLLVCECADLMTNDGFSLLHPFSFSRATLKKNHKSIFATVFILFVLFHSISLPPLSLFPVQYAKGHFDHLSHYNGGGFGISDKYYVNQQLDPTYTKPNELSHVMFSIQDNAGRDVHDIVAMVEIYSLSGERVSVFPWTHLEIGDFGVPFVFPKAGSYQIVLSVLNSDVGSSQIINTVPPARSILGDVTGCNCERGVFNVSITQNFGTIFVMVIYVSILLAISVLGAALIWIFWSRRNKKAFNPLSNNDFIKYSVLFLAFGASVVHLAVAPGHAGLRLEYSIFLITASAVQLAYGISYVLLIFSEDTDVKIRKYDKMLVTKKYYKKSLKLNLIGLMGSLFLIFLYLYAVTFPPPLSPNPHPEDVDIAGIADKSLEVILVIGILFLMRYEKRRYLYSIKSSSFKKV